MDLRLPIVNCATKGVEANVEVLNQSHGIPGLCVVARTQVVRNFKK